MTQTDFIRLTEFENKRGIIIRARDVVAVYDEGNMRKIAVCDGGCTYSIFVTETVDEIYPFLINGGIKLP